MNEENRSKCCNAPIGVKGKGLSIDNMVEFCTKCRQEIKANKK